MKTCLASLEILDLPTVDAMPGIGLLAPPLVHLRKLTVGQGYTRISNMRMQDNVVFELPKLTVLEELDIRGHAFDMLRFDYYEENQVDNSLVKVGIS